MYVFRIIGGLALGITMALSAAAQDAAANYPSRPVTVVIPFAAGGTTDNETRMYTEKLQAGLKQPFVFDFRGGAGSSIGVGYTLKAAPDGYVILMTNSSLTVFPNFYPALDHSVVSRIVPITELSSRSTALLVSVAALPQINNLKQFVSWAKVNSGKLNCNTAGAGGITHIVCAAASNALDVPIIPIHYKGSGPGTADLIAGRTQVAAGTLFSAMAHIKSGKLRPIAILSAERVSVLPDLATSHEQGFALDYPSWQGVFAPPGTPSVIVGKLHAELAKAVKSPDVIKVLDGAGSVPVGSPPVAFRKKFLGELAYWKKVVETNGITLDN